MKYSFKMMLILVMLIVAACGGNDPAPTVAPVQPTDPPPVESVEPEVEADAEETLVEVPTDRPAERPTLPPTWTPLPTFTPLPPTATNTPLPTIEIQEIPEICNQFGLNMAETDEQIQLGETATVSWQNIPDAQLYWVVVSDENGFEVHQGYTAENNYIIPDGSFVSAIRYGWEVRPLNDVGEQMCRGVGNRIIVRP